ncbi:protein-tyrosine sulfotransferase 1 [Aplysia californica]|uniref:Protein-tyrosine sulfotransferase n=1 Tax=Aplysia californica TaxID=6500 RepID=A0ABM1AEV8_APLCA|nr:protein-tyrosine sulfotransferase 1 [Aplysia californica]
MGLCRQLVRQKLYFLLAGLVFLYIVYRSFPCDSGPSLVMVPKEQTKFMYDDRHRAIPYGDDMPIIFVGGMPRSGTTLMRAMLDAHPEIRCGEETRVIPRILGMRTQWERSALEKKRLTEAGVTGEVMDSAVRAFILEIIAKHGPAAPHLCNKDPFTLKSTVYLNKQFPNSKFILMIRDGRAVVHSIITRKVTISGFDLNSYRKCLSKWNSALETMYSQCLHVGQGKCMPVYYEQLALHPKEWMARILRFLDIPWNESVLHHEEFIGKPGGIALSKTEKSTDQVIKPVNVDALSKWVGSIPDDVVRDMESIAPMLRTLGYDPKANPPNYGKPDPEVADNTIHIKKNADFWQRREVDVRQNGADDTLPQQQQPQQQPQQPQQLQQQQGIVLQQQPPNGVLSQDQGYVGRVERMAVNEQRGKGR